jgi:putative membrane protein
MHAVGAHYTYSEVPYDELARSLTGHSLEAAFGWQRNHYDRAVQFAYGLLLAPLAVQLLDRRAPQEGWWRWLLPVLFLASHSVIYEVIEMLAAMTFGGDLGTAYLGTQGDPWDAQKDMALAMSGAAISVAWLRVWRPLPRD